MSRYEKKVKQKKGAEEKIKVLSGVESNLKVELLSGSSVSAGHTSVGAPARCLEGNAAPGSRVRVGRVVRVVRRSEEVERGKQGTRIVARILALTGGRKITLCIKKKEIRILILW